MDKHLARQNREALSRPVALVAGGAGFIGSYLCELLLMKDCRVIAVDNLQTGQKENLKKCFGHPHFTFLKQDLLRPLVGFKKVDYIFHLAGLEAYLDDRNISLEVLKVNALGTENLLKLAKKYGAKFLLASSVLYNEVEISGQDLDHYFTNNGLGSRIGNLNEAKRFAEVLTNQHFHRESIDARIVRLGFAYGPRMSLETSGFLARLFKEALAGRCLKIPDNEALKVYPTFVSDVVYGMVKAMFSSGSSGKIFSLINPEAVSPIGLVNQIKAQSLDSLKVELVADSAYPYLPIDEQEGKALDEQGKKSRAVLRWQPQVGFQEGIKQTFEYFGKHQSKSSSKSASLTGKASLLGRDSVKKSKAKLTMSMGLVPRALWNIFFKHLSLRLTVFLLILGIIFYLPASFIWQTIWGAKSLVQAQESFEELELAKGTKKSLVAQKAFNRARKRLEYLSYLFKVADLENIESKADKLLMVGSRLGLSGHQAGSAALAAVELGQMVFQGGEGDAGKIIDGIRASTNLAYEQMSLAESEYLSEEWPLSLAIPFGQSRQLLLQADQVLEILPDLIGLEGERVYLVLLQNNMEIRPTGGFIGSFALVDFQEGRLNEFKVQDVYSADGQLKGHVEPPAAIKQYLGEAGWYLRDSNWHPNFPNSALSAEWFLEKETKDQVDGVIGVNLFVAQKIIDQLGEIELVDFNEKVTAENLFEKASSYSEAGFFPGSTQKKDFLSSLSRSLFEEIRLADQSTWFSVGRAVFQSLKEREILVYLNNSVSEQVIVGLDWDGGLKEIDCRLSTEGCYLDYLMIVEANVGVNKANYFVERSMSHQIKIDQKGVVRKILQITYLNRSESEVFPSGRYKDYLRILVPQGSKIEKVEIDGKVLKKGSIDRGILAGKTSFGFLVEVPVKGESAVEVHYQLSKKIDLKKPVRYIMLLQKQSGIRDEAFHFWLSVPEGLRIVDVWPRMESETSLLGGDLRTYLTSPTFDQDIVFESLIKSR